MQALPQGRKSHVEVLPDGKSVQKTYNTNGNRDQKYKQEVGFYVQYGHSGLMPSLVDHKADEYIVIDRVAGERLSDVGPIANNALLDLTDDFAEKVATLFEDAPPIAKVQRLYYDGIGASENVASLLEALYRLQSDYAGCQEILAEICSSVQRVEVSQDLLIKLDWNPENLFLKDGKVHKFIDFEQAFIGTKEMLVGVLLHNPFWPASRLFRQLKKRGLFGFEGAALCHYMAFSFGSVLVDSIERRGKPWDAERLRTAYQRHVVSRYKELSVSVS